MHLTLFNKLAYIFDDIYKSNLHQFLLKMVKHKMCVTRKTQGVCQYADRWYIASLPLSRSQLNCLHLVTRFRYGILFKATQCLFYIRVVREILNYLLQ